MGIAFLSSLFDEPNAPEVKTREGKPRFKVAATFVIDISISILFAIAVVPYWLILPRYGGPVWPTLLIALPIAACYFGKVFTIAHLDRAGGDARTYVKSCELVTDGPYAISRNPTYLLAMIQFLLWAVLAVYLQVFEPWRPLMIGAAIVLPLAFFLINDWVVMPTEEAMLKSNYPEAFDSYASRVNRWIGRKTPLN